MVLRRSLAAATGSRLAVRASRPGYRLDAAPGELDWHCFRDLSAAAAGCLSSDPAAAGRLLRQALGLWRGDALADVADGVPLLQARLAAMEEERLGVLEQRIEADLAAGRHRELLGELAELVLVHPLRERFRAHQMVALYRCGRQAEALSVFHRLRTELTTELGIEPGHELSRLFQALLRADPSLDWPGAVPAPPGEATPVARQFRTLGQCLDDEEARAYQGRRAELDRARSLLGSTGRLPRILQLHGPPGIGKTAFVYALARMCSSRDCAAVILDSRDFCHQMTALSEAVTARCAAAVTPGSDQPLLLAFDTFEEMRDMERTFWEVFLPRLQGPVLVVLSGRQPAHIGDRPGRWRGLVEDMELPVLSAAESGRLLRYHGVTDPATAASIASFGRGNPLYLTVAAHYARSPGTRDAVSGAARALIGRMTSEIVDPDQRTLLEAASLVRTFNEELLTAMTGRDIPGGFAGLCG